MRFKAITSAFFIGITFALLMSSFWGQTPVFAENFSDPISVSKVKRETVSLEPANTLELSLGKFLSSSPKAYYKLGSVNELKTLISTQRPLLIDVRQPTEYKSGHIPNAVNIPLDVLTDHLDQIPQDQPVVLYCSSGYRSAMGVMALHLLGYSNVQGFLPSFVGWQASGESIAKS